MTMECGCGREMVEVMSIETGNCSDGCCPSYTRLFQCPECKTVKAKE
jgi:hypothetical protein